MAFSPKPGCPMCGIVSTASGAAPGSLVDAPSSTHPDILWRDENFTAYRERDNPVSSRGHIIIAFNLHVPSIYTLSSSDLPLLVSIRSIGQRLLSGLLAPSGSDNGQDTGANGQYRIGFITPPFKDTKIPVTDHLHAHAYIAPADLMGWFRSVGFGPLAWYAIDDLVAEIRETVSNNRVKSGYQNRRNAPIDQVSGAGARSGTADGVETSKPSVGVADISAAEEGQTIGTPSTNPLLAVHSPILQTR